MTLVMSLKPGFSYIKEDFDFGKGDSLKKQSKSALFAYLSYSIK